MSPPESPQTFDEDTDPALTDHLSVAETAIRDHYADYIQTVTDRLDDLQSELDQALDRHAALREDLTLEASLSLDDRSNRSPLPNTDRTDWQPLWTQICSYRQRMRREVLTPLHNHLSERPLGSLLLDQRTALVENLQGVVNDCPPEHSRPEPDLLYAPDAEDGWYRGLRKAWVRSWRRAQSLLDSENDRAPVHTVPLRPLVRHQVARLLEHHQPILDSIEDRLMGWLARLERVFTSLTHRLLEFEQRIDHLDFHHTGADSFSSATGPSPNLPESLDVPQAPPSADVLSAVRDEIDALDDILQQGLTLSIDDLRTRLSQHVDDQISALHAAANRPWPAQSDTIPTVQQRAWPSWERQARARLKLCATMIAFYGDTEEIRDALIDELVTKGPAFVNERFEMITDDLTDTDATLQDLLDDRVDPDALTPPLEDALTTVAHHLDALRDVSLGARLQSVIQSQLEALQARVEDLPETITVHALSAPNASPDPSVDAYEVPVRAGAEVTFDVLFADHVRSETQHVIDVLAEEIDRAEQVIEVLRFGRDSTEDGSAETDAPPSPAALPHDLPETGAFRSPPESPDPSTKDTDALTRGSVQRSIRLVRARQTRVETAAYEWADTIWHDFRHGMTRLHDQWTTESRFQSRLVQLTRQVAREARDAAAEAQEHVQHGRLHLREGVEQVRQWLDAGRTALQSALGLTDPDPKAVSKSIETIASLGTSLEELPIVYRRLFSFDPVDDPELFKGREEERRFVERYVKRWRRGMPASLLLVGDRGSGLTSLLKMVRATTLQDATLHHLRLDGRPDTEAQIAAQVARTFDLDIPSNASLSLDDVGEALRNAPSLDPGPASSSVPVSNPDPDVRTTPVRVCFVEHLEQLLLQTVGGLDLLDRMLTLISRTDAHILWIGTMSTAAWQLVKKRLPTAAELITHERVDPLSRDAIEAAIMSRHRRSGLSLHFEADESRPLSSQSSQDERREAFFDRLHDASHQNVALALLYWFRSVEPREDGTGLRVKPLQPISFRVLDELTMKQSFALKAFLVHSSLTIEEYSEIAQIPIADSVDVMESLGNASLIEPVDGPADRTFNVYFEAATRKVSYRIRPLLVAPIVQHLKTHNIVH